jgi:hypothetical protein
MLRVEGRGDCARKADQTLVAEEEDRVDCRDESDMGATGEGLLVGFAACDFAHVFLRDVYECCANPVRNQ